MFPKYDDLSRSRRVVGVALGALLFAVACATGGAVPATDAQSSITSLGAVSVESGEDGTVVRLEGVSEPVFSAFQQDDPARVVVDLSDVMPGTGAPETSVDDGTVSSVSVAGFEGADGSTSTRIELSLATDASFDVVNVEGGLEIRVTPEDAFDTVGSDATLEAATLSDPWAGTFDETPVVEATEEGSAPEMAATDEPVETEAAPMVEVVEETPALPATLLLSIDFEGSGDDALVNLRTDGRVEEFNQFLVEDPARLVIDLPGLVSGLDNDRFDVGMGGIERVRVGQHADKLRVVLDASEGSDGLLTARGLAGDDALYVATGSARLPELSMAEVPSAAADDGDEVEVEMAEEATPIEDPTGIVIETAPETEVVETEEIAEPEMATETSESDELAAIPASIEDDAEASSEEASWEEAAEVDSSEAAMDELMNPTSVSTVAGVSLDRQGDRDRLAIRADQISDYQVVRPDASTLIVRLTPARLAEDATRRVVPETAGPVSLVTAFEQPDTSSSEVRVVVQRAQGLEPSITSQDGVLILDFMRGEDVAATPPALAVEKASGKASQDMGAPPAAIDPDDGALDILEEGGLIDGKQYTGRRISLDFKDVDIDDVLRLIAEVSDLNIIAGDEVSGQVTIRLVDVPWDQALDVILLTKGLGFVRVGNVLRIAPSEQLKAEEEARLQERRAKEKLEDLVVKLQPVNYASVKEVEKMVKRLLTPRGSVDVDQRTNTIILKDIASVVDEATALVKAIDTQTPQVLIEAKIVEANLDFSKELGSQWAFGAQPLVDGLDPNSGDRGDLTIGGRENVQFHNNPLLTGFTDTFNHVSVQNPITSVPTGLLDLGAFILDQKFNVELRLEAAESHGEGKVISSPRVVTLDNRKASIEQGVSIPFQTFENGDAKLEFIDAVLRLEVTPHITADRSIIMKIEVNRNAPDDSVQTPTGSPAIAKNEAETETLVKDGQTLVIGGIYTIEKADRQSRVPYFHKIPVLGNAFKNNETRDIRKELLVFVTPRIVVNPAAGS
ncbi:MAG: type IV pilus secretin PilQ [Myxococcota bacterium]|nr:type IV pilus secretin PilQ [Myxococcota bacterium]